MGKVSLWLFKIPGTPGGVIDQVTDPRRMTLLSSVGLNGRRGENVAG